MIPPTCNYTNQFHHSQSQTRRSMRETTTKMPKPKLNPSTTLYLTLLLFLSICNGEMEKRVCTKSIGECLEESEMDSEINRRVLLLQKKKYISYETLKRGMVPCTKPGASYYNCQPRQANPYNRGCEVITGCARIVSDIKY